jgi:hypothetical protein
LQHGTHSAFQPVPESFLDDNLSLTQRPLPIMASLKSLDTDIEMAKNNFRKENTPLSDVPPEGSYKQYVDGLCICLNIASTVLLVFLNKWYVDLSMGCRYAVHWLLLGREEWVVDSIVNAGSSATRS